LQPKGLITLNLDKFAGEAMAAANPGRVVTPVYGMELAQKWSTLLYAPQYLVYLHGDLSDPSNWVVTMDQFNKLMDSKMHQHFLFSLYSQHLVLFVGLGLQDIALSSRLLELKRENFRPPGLYWLTTRLDPETAKWADANDVSFLPIRLLPTPAKCGVRPFPGVKPVEGWRDRATRYSEQRAERVKGIEAPIESKGELVEVGL